MFVTNIAIILRGRSGRCGVSPLEGVGGYAVPLLAHDDYFVEVFASRNSGLVRTARNVLARD